MHSPIRSAADDFEVVRDPLWNTIRLDPLALRIIDTPAFQRLRHIKQLGHAYLVYPGATHTRFDHALGVYHLARRTLHLLAERGELREVEPVHCRIASYAALLHDIGHYPFSHALEELGPEQLAEHHESLTARFLESPELARVLAELDDGAARAIEQMIRGESASPLQGLVAGSLDLDKIEYLNRDAHFCGVPYGTVDVDRLIHALTLLRDPGTQRLEIGIHEKGLSALESLLFAKYQMFRNVYWHHGVRAATVLYKRAVQDAIVAGLLSSDDLVGRTDEGLLGLLEARATASDEPAARRLLERWLPSLRNRRLPKRVLELPGEAVRELGIAEWYYDRPDLQRKLEERIAGELELPTGSVFIDYPEKPHMMGLDLLLLQRDGGIVRLPERGHSGLIDLPRIADQLYHSARVLRIFSTERRTLAEGSILDLLAEPASRLESRLESATPLL
ncbi:MAG: HD domain-containing protein [Gemmatimonadota bacterium]